MQKASAKRVTSRYPSLNSLACCGHGSAGCLLNTQQRFDSDAQLFSLLYQIVTLSPQTVDFSFFETIDIVWRETIQRTTDVGHKIFNNCVGNVANERLQRKLAKCVLVDKLQVFHFN